MIVEWVSYTKFDKSREADIQSCFNCEMEFQYPKNKENFEDLLQELKLCARPNKLSDCFDCTDSYNSYGEI